MKEFELDSLDVSIYGTKEFIGKEEPYLGYVVRGYKDPDDNCNLQIVSNYEFRHMDYNDALGAATTYCSSQRNQNIDSEIYFGVFPIKRPKS